MLCACKNELTVAEAACCAVKLSTASGSHLSSSYSCFTVPTNSLILEVSCGRLPVYRCVRTAVSILLIVQPNPTLLPGI